MGYKSKIRFIPPIPSGEVTTKQVVFLPIWQSLEREQKLSSLLDEKEPIESTLELLKEKYPEIYKKYKTKW